MSSSSSLEFFNQAQRTSGTQARSAFGAPQATVVFAVRDASEKAKRAARMLHEHCRLNGSELLIVASWAWDRFPLLVTTTAEENVARIVEAPLDADCATLRQLGLRNTKADIITFIDDRTLNTCHPLELVGPRLPRARDDTSHATAGLLSVIVPAHNAATTLGACLAAISASDLSRDHFEVIVVDDSSNDDSALIAARVADRIVRLHSDEPFGPAYARNRGVEFARGEYVVFVDADVCLHSDALGRFAAALEEDETIGAILGSYDADAADPGLISQYRNLLYHFFHQQASGEAQAFWAGCGAVRMSVFMQAGMYDEWRFPRPQIEDIDLGHRILDLGFRLTLIREIQACHLRCWTMRDIMATDFMDRAVPWMRVLSQRVPRARSRSIGLRAVETIGTLLTWIALVCVVAGTLLHQRSLAYVAAVAMICVVLQERDRLAFFHRQRGPLFTIAALALDALYFLTNGAALASGWLLREVLGDPAPSPRIEAFAEVGVRSWPPVHAKSHR